MCVYIANEMNFFCVNKYCSSQEDHCFLVIQKLINYSEYFGTYNTKIMVTVYMHVYIGIGFKYTVFSRAVIK